VGALAALVAHLGWWGILLDAVVAVIIFAAIFLLARRNRVTARDLDHAKPAQFVRPKPRGKKAALAAAAAEPKLGEAP
jgi:inorganic phosphate transporter, PiT family